MLPLFFINHRLRSINAQLCAARPAETVSDRSALPALVAIDIAALRAIDCLPLFCFVAPVQFSLRASFLPAGLPVPHAAPHDQQQSHPTEQPG
jgi:hypothetical protein